MANEGPSYRLMGSGLAFFQIVLDERLGRVRLTSFLPHGMHRSNTVSECCSPCLYYLQSLFPFPEPCVLLVLLVFDIESGINTQGASEIAREQWNDVQWRNADVRRGRAIFVNLRVRAPILPDYRSIRSSTIRHGTPRTQ
jgi:hypothetical protein